MSATELANLYCLMEKFSKSMDEIDECFMDLLSEIFDQGVDACDGSSKKFLDVVFLQKKMMNQKQ
jgi:hypothetical protein